MQTPPVNKTVAKKASKMPALHELSYGRRKKWLRRLRGYLYPSRIVVHRAIRSGKASPFMLRKQSNGRPMYRGSYTSKWTEKNNLGIKREKSLTFEVGLFFPMISAYRFAELEDARRDGRI